jgi:glycerol-3-phosphate acyltransferase PlsY
MSDTLKRGLFHLFGVLSIPVAALFLPRTVLLVSLGAVTFIALALELIRLKVPLINRWFLSFFKPLLRKEEALRLTGTSYSLAGALIVFLVFPRDIAILAVSFLAVGDAMATIVGKQIGKTRLLGKRTLEGDLACFVSCIAVGFIGYFAGLKVSWLAILVGSLGATIAEAVPLPLNDNLTLPLFAGLVMFAI